MVKRNLLTRVLLKWMPNNEQSAYERRLVSVMKKLKIQDYNFNWDRTSCYVEFSYNDNFYRLDHSVEKAQKKGIVLRNGLDCLMELTLSLEELCGIIDRGFNDFDTWIAGMKQPPSETETPEFQEEFEIRYKSMGRQNTTEHNIEDWEEPISFEKRPFRRGFERNQMSQRTLDDDVGY